MTVEDVPVPGLEVPEGSAQWEAWGVHEVGALGRIYGGLTGKSKADFNAGEARYVPFTSVLERAVLKAGELPRVRVGERERQNEVRVGDVLFNVSSETPDELALSTCVASVPERTYLNSFCFGYRLHPELDVDPRFLAYWFRGSGGRRLLYALAQGAIRYNLSKTQFKSLRMVLPGSREQRAIVAALLDADETIAALKRLVGKKRSVKRGAMQLLLTGRARLPGFDGEWSVHTLGALGTLMKGRGIRRDDVRGQGVPCIRYGELYTRYSDYVAQPTSRVDPAVASTALPIVPGDLLFAASGETAAEIGTCVAYTGTERAVAGGDIVVLRTRGEHDPVFLASLLNSPKAQEQKARLGQGDAVVHISSSALGSIEVELPAQQEQEAIARVIIDMDAEIEALEARLAKARDIKQGMMQELLTGGRRLAAEGVPA